MGQTTLKQRQIAGGLDGWIPAEETWTYASADDPTFTFTVAADVTTKYSAGMKIKLTQGTVKYFIITAVSTYSGGKTTITVYGGTDYDLASSAISANAYSMMKSPLGFPMSPAKWSETVTDTTQRSQATPTSATWYNLGSISITLPIGVWDVSYKVSLIGGVSSTGAFSIQTTLSTTNNSNSDTEFHMMSYIQTDTIILASHNKGKILEIGTKTVYYINSLINSASANLLRNDNNSSPLIIRATCAYL
jgi:hypothetical protein